MGNLVMCGCFCHTAKYVLLKFKRYCSKKIYILKVVYNSVFSVKMVFSHVLHQYPISAAEAFVEIRTKVAIALFGLIRSGNHAQPKNGTIIEKSLLYHI